MKNEDFWLWLMLACLAIVTAFDSMVDGVHYERLKKRIEILEAKEKP